MNDTRLKAVGYARVSKADTKAKAERLSLDAQADAIRRAAEFNDWDLLAIHEDEGKTGANMRRDGLSEVRAMLKRGDADMLVIARHDRLSRDHLDFGGLLREADKQGWYVSVLDQRVDTSTAMGWYMASQMSLSAELERRLISERTRDALAVLKASGKQLGRPSPITDPVKRKVLRLSKRGLSASAIARQLTADGHPTPSGKPWHHSVVVDLLKREAVSP